MKTLPVDHEVMHTLSVPTFSAGGQRCRLSRRYVGIHFQSGEYAGRGLRRQVTQFVWGTAGTGALQRADAVIVAPRGRRHHA